MHRHWEPTAPLKRINEKDNCHILLEANCAGHQVVDRRVKRTNQLVIDRYIYDEIQMRMETVHSLPAAVDGHRIKVAID